mgnify:CR=1 FL=1
MKRFKIRKRYRKTKVGLVVLALVLFFTYIFYQGYQRASRDILVKVTLIKLNEFMERFLSNNIGYDLIKDEDLENIIKINKNKEGEILYVNYNLNVAYKLLEVVTEELEENIKDLKYGSIEDRDILINNNILMLKLPFFIGSKNPFVTGLGPKVYVPINFSGSLLTNLKTQIKDYGLNNALVEIYVRVKITSNILYPYSSVSEVIDYDVLIASSIINGKVPSFYGGMIDTKSNNVSIPID